MSVTAVLAGISAAAGIGSTLYNLWSNKRDYDYQKSLQQQIFEREDTAVQRRMQDLENAGLNPNLAAGSAANAGSIVSRSNTNDVNAGSALDLISAVNQIKMQKQQIENAKKEGEILSQQKDKTQRENALDTLTTLYSLGFNVKPIVNQDGYLDYAWKSEWRDDGLYNDFSAYKTNRIFDNIDYQNSYMKNSADLLQKDNDWYTTDKVSGLVLGSLGLLKPQFAGGHK